MSEDSNPIVFPSFLKPSKVLSTSGAGDSAFGALIAVYTAMESWKEAAAAGSVPFGHLCGVHLSSTGMHAASLSCQSYDTVNHNLKCNSLFLYSPYRLICFDDASAGMTPLLTSAC